ncbi:ATP-binding protein [Corynebacterium pseudodiphtheriticum]|uniref:ATP-binding protein n=1 Tax=Corynebacterium pseudodiphtheriticum TaxID=37637 RepID=UPI003D711854
MTTTQIVVLAVVVTVLVTAVLLVAGAVWLRRGGQLGRFGAEEQTQDSDRILESNQVATVGQMLHLVIQSSPTGIVVVDRNGDVMLSNARAHDMALVHARTINPQVWRVAANVFDDEEKENRYLELSVPKHRTGNRISNVRALVKPLTLVDDRFMIVYGTDESENVRMQSARRDFVANVSHELKTPVGGMALLAEALLGSPDDPEHVTHFGRQLQREANRMADMVNELISLSKLQGAEALPEIAPVSVAEVISAAIARNQVAAENHGIILRNLGAVKGTNGATGGDAASGASGGGATSDGATGGDGTGGAESNSGLFVVGNRNLLVTAVSNLVSNAINYSPDSTPVTVSYEAVSAEEICIHVVDQGIGIASEDQERVFERFFRVDKARSRQTGGTGLGLAIVKHVVANHGGNIRLFSELGEGTTFTLALPRYQGDGMAGHEMENHDLENLEDLEGLDNWGTPENPEGLPVREKPEEP